uniref:IQ motif and SEC7 domain-containing protein n=1 Tax=Hucho hucho TaxID=62062 RepID=A0A4W5R761_9TELE
MHFTLFENEYYPHGITIVSPFGSDKKQVLNFCAQSAEELLKFLEDLKESIAEVSEMEQIRIEWELEKQQGSKGVSAKNNGTLELRSKQGSPSGKQDLDENSGHNAVELTVSYHRTRKSRRFQRRRGRGGTSRWRSSNQTA